jgi:hypothetical protein
MARERGSSWRYVREVDRIHKTISHEDDPVSRTGCLLAAAEVDRLPEEEVALECLLWGHRYARLFRYFGSGPPAGEVPEADRLKWSLDVANLAVEKQRLFAKYRPPAVPSVHLPLLPAVSHSFRASRAGKGQVLVLRNTGTERLGALQIKVNAGPEKPIGALEPGRQKELGWIELGHALQRGDTVQVWDGTRLVVSAIVP